MSLITQLFRPTPEDIATASAPEGGRAMSFVTFVLGTAGLGAVIGLGVATVIARVVGDGRFGEDFPAGLSGWLAFGLTVAILAAYARKADRSSRSIAERMTSDQRVDFAEDGVRLIGEYGVTLTHWCGIAGATWHGDDLLLRLRAGPVVMVPGRSLPEAADRAALRELISARLPG